MDKYSMFLFALALSLLLNALCNASVPELPVPELQQQVLSARHNPLCVLYDEPDSGSSLEKLIQTVWQEHNNTVAWINVTTFPQHAPSIIPGVSAPDKRPCLRCYLGASEVRDYSGPNRTRPLLKWIQQLYDIHGDQLLEASVSTIVSNVHSCALTVVALSTHHSHMHMEETFYQLRDTWSERRVCFFFGHPNTEDVREIKGSYSVKTLPAVLFLEHNKYSKQGVSVKHVLSGQLQVTRNNIELELFTIHFKLIKLNPKNFASEALDESKYARPLFVVFYTPGRRESVEYVAALTTSLQDLHNLHVDARFGLMDLSQPGVTEVIQPRVPAMVTNKPPFTVLFDIKWGKKAVVGIDQIVMRDRPSPQVVAQALHQHGKSLKHVKTAEPVLFQPYAPWDDTMMSHTSEGPHGCLCFETSHNQTDNQPYERPRQSKLIKQGNQTEKADKTVKSCWHERFGSEHIDAKLERLGDIPLVTDAAWQEVVEKSHAPNHPYSGAPWSGEVTKVTLIVFVQAGCGSCARNMDVFAEIHRQAVRVEGGAFYLMNCTKEPRTCANLAISGFPSVVAFRGQGWLEGEHCLTREALQGSASVRLDYHGVMMVAPVMEWFSQVATPAVNDIGWGHFEQKTSTHSHQPIHIVASIEPWKKNARPAGYDFACLRVVCERLFGHAQCHVRYTNKEVVNHDHDDDDEDEDVHDEWDEEDNASGESEFYNTGSRMHVTQVYVLRSDGMKAVVMETGIPLASLLEAEEAANKGLFHIPHRYDLTPGQLCEDDVAACTDLLVHFVRDHARLPVTDMTLAAFHTKNSVLFHNDLPILVALVQQEHVKPQTKFNKLLWSVATELYAVLVTVTVDVDQYPAWASQFVPKGYSRKIIQAEETGESIPDLFVYPRLCLLHWSDHSHAAFYPPMDSLVNADHPFTFNKIGVMQFITRFMKNPHEVMLETEHF